MGLDPISLPVARPEEQRATARTGRVELHWEARAARVILDAAIFVDAHVPEIRRRRMLAIRGSIPWAIPHTNAVNVDGDEALVRASRRLLSEDGSAVSNRSPRSEINRRA